MNNVAIFGHYECKNNILMCTALQVRWNINEYTPVNKQKIKGRKTILFIFSADFFCMTCTKK